MTHKISALEQAELECRNRDAAELRRAVGAIWRFCTAPHDPNADAIERAKLVCQMRDAKTLRDTVASVSHADASRGMDNVARA